MKSTYRSTQSNYYNQTHTLNTFVTVFAEWMEMASLLNLRWHRSIKTLEQNINQWLWPLICQEIPLILGTRNSKTFQRCQPLNSDEKNHGSEIAECTLVSHCWGLQRSSWNVASYTNVKLSEEENYFTFFIVWYVA